jgi:hypothetical protein
VVILNSYDFIFIFVCDDYWRAAKIPALGKGYCMGRSVSERRLPTAANLHSLQ